MCIRDRRKRCKDGSSWRPHKLTRGSYIVQLTAPMMQEIFHYGPIAATMSVYEDLLNYTNGVYKQNSDKSVGLHAVKIIGWGVEAATPYWLIQNSWTTRWGDRGFFKLLRGDDSCECGICNMNIGGMFFGNHSHLTKGRAHEGGHE